MPITAQQLLQILPNAGAKAGVFVPVLNTAKVRFQVVGAKRVAAFIAQIGHESGRWLQVPRAWPDPDHRPGELCGVRRSPGPGPDQPAGAAGAAEKRLSVGRMVLGTNGVNTLADADKFEAITRRINGGLNGQADRLKLWKKATAVLV